MKNKFTTKTQVENMIKEAIQEFAVIVNKGFEEQNKMIKRSFEKQARVFDLKLNTTINKAITESEKRLRRESLGHHDEVMHELKAIRAEQAANLGAHERMQGVLDNHEARLIKLESVR